MADNVNVVNNDNSIPFRQIQDHPRQECMLSDKLPKTISAIHMTTIPNLVILLMLRTLMIEFFNLFKTLSSFNMDVVTSNSLVIISAMIAQASTTVLTLKKSDSLIAGKLINLSKGVNFYFWMFCS